MSSEQITSVVWDVPQHGDIARMQCSLLQRTEEDNSTGRFMQSQEQSLRSELLAVGVAGQKKSHSPKAKPHQPSFTGA